MKELDRSQTPRDKDAAGSWCVCKSRLWIGKVRPNRQQPALKSTHTRVLWSKMSSTAPETTSVASCLTHAIESAGAPGSTSESRVDSFPTTIACAVLVTYNPGQTISRSVLELLDLFSEVVIVDNGSDAVALSTLRELAANTGCTLLPNDVNQGVATALNQGLQWAENRGYTWAATFDQDSMPERGFIPAMSAAISLPTARPFAIVGPRILGDLVPEHESKWLAVSEQSRFLFRRRTCACEGTFDVTVVITSGAFTNVAAWRSIGGFQEDLFIDYVDTEFCLRALSAGYRVSACCAARLRHNLGNRRVVRFLGRDFMPTFHSPSRHYYTARNRIHVLRQHGRAFPHWLLADILMGTYNLFRVAFLEDNRREKLSATARGTLAGLQGRKGVLEHRLPS